ncbi:hypothetical protein RDI58_010645 [Solanum bulbocastanum]|uniref:Uncharacterized protein n=1 Tax=Solanum bulbocastanum TaxID=147425 RepID=A0AAN8TPT9_SOLBU
MYHSQSHVSGGGLGNISGDISVYRAGASKPKINIDETFSYLNQVKDKFHNQREKYITFLVIMMDFKRKRSTFLLSKNFTPNLLPHTFLHEHLVNYSELKDTFSMFTEGCKNGKEVYDKVINIYNLSIEILRKTLMLFFISTIFFIC